SGGIRTVVRQQPQKFQPETIAATIAHRGGYAEPIGSLKFDLHQITRLQRDSSIQRHTAAADFSGQPRDGYLGNVVSGNDTDGQFHLMTQPTAGVWGSHCYYSAPDYFSTCAWSR